jgi:hypothetical protein
MHINPRMIGKIGLVKSPAPIDDLTDRGDDSIVQSFYLIHIKIFQQDGGVMVHPDRVASRALPIRGPLERADRRG